MKKLLFIALILLSSCGQEHTYNVKYKVTFNNGDVQTFDENWDLRFKPTSMYLESDRGGTACAKICGGCISNACGVRTVETLSITEIK